MSVEIFPLSFFLLDNKDCKFVQRENDFRQVPFLQGGIQGEPHEAKRNPQKAVQNDSFTLLPAVSRGITGCRATIEEKCTKLSLCQNIKCLFQSSPPVFPLGNIGEVPVGRGGWKDGIQYFCSITPSVTTCHFAYILHGKTQGEKGGLFTLWLCKRAIPLDFLLSRYSH